MQKPKEKKTKLGQALIKGLKEAVASTRPSYVWYSPKLNDIRLAPFGECKQYKSCNWLACPTYWYKPGIKKSKKLSWDSLAAYYYIGEL